MDSKKAIGPVVATALIVVVAVIAVVAFQTWFGTYQSGVNSKTEQEANSGSSLTIERLENSSVFIKNSGTEDIVLIGGSKITDSDGVSLCTIDIASLTAKNVTQVPTTGCSLSANVKHGVVLISTGGVYSFTQIAR